MKSLWNKATHSEDILKILYKNVKTEFLFTFCRLAEQDKIIRDLELKLKELGEKHKFDNHMHDAVSKEHYKIGILFLD